MAITDATDVAQDQEEQGRFRSARGRFKIFKAPKIKRRRQIPEDFDTSAIVDGFDYSPLLADNDEADVRTKLDGMIRAINPGVSETLLFSQKGPQGMSLVHVWFGANMPLFRHSHPRFGDCLYYIITGEVRLGSQVLGAGDGVCCSTSRRSTRCNRSSMFPMLSTTPGWRRHPRRSPGASRQPCSF